MTEFPQIPDHYVKPTIDNMFPGDIYYPSSEIMQIDRISRQPYIPKYEHLSDEDLRPRLLIGRFGIMRVWGDSESGVADGYIVDLRPVNFSDVQQDDFAPRPGDSEHIIDELNQDLKDLISPLGIIASPVKKDVDPVLFLGDETLRPHMEILLNNTNAVMDELNIRWGRMEQLRMSRMAKRHIDPSTETVQDSNKRSKKSR